MGQYFGLHFDCAYECTVVDGYMDRRVQAVQASRFESRNSRCKSMGVNKRMKSRASSADNVTKPTAPSPGIHGNSLQDDMETAADMRQDAQGKNVCDLENSPQTVKPSGPLFPLNKDAIMTNEALENDHGDGDCAEHHDEEHVISHQELSGPQLGVASRKNSKMSQQLPRNELTRLIPGYRAPLQLGKQTVTTVGQPSVLDQVRAKAMSKQLRGRAVGSVEPSSGLLQHKHASAMLQKANSGASPTIPYKLTAKPLSKRKRDAMLAQSIAGGAALPSAGANWFDMAGLSTATSARSTEDQQQLQRDLTILRNRNYLNPARFYKSMDRVGPVVQVGTVIASAMEGGSSYTKRERPQNFMDEIMKQPGAASNSARDNEAVYVQTKYKTMQREQTAKAMHRIKHYKRQRGPQKRR
jgi:Fcf2 pre-rRNA processing